MRHLILLIPVCFFLGVSVFAKNHTATFIICAVDENGSSIPDVDITVSFEQNNDAGSEIVHKGKTDTKGLFSVDESTSGFIYFEAFKSGFYKSQRSLKWHHNQNSDGSFAFSGSRVETTLREIKSPISLYAKHVYTHLPEPDVEYGYDFEVGDWVAPHGQGKASDAFFKVEGYWNSRHDNDSTLTLRFPNTGDGLFRFDAVALDSVFVAPYFAPECGYVQILKWRKSRKLNGGATQPHNSQFIHDDRDVNANYFFRIRTQLNADGNVESALYGKIYGDVEYGGASNEGCYLKIKSYYLNPTPNDRNLEFDPTQNLFEGEKVFAP